MISALSRAMPRQSKTTARYRFTRVEDERFAASNAAPLAVQCRNRPGPILILRFRGPRRMQRRVPARSSYLRRAGTGADTGAECALQRPASACHLVELCAVQTIEIGQGLAAECQPLTCSQLLHGLLLSG